MKITITENSFLEKPSHQKEPAEMTDQTTTEPVTGTATQPAETVTATLPTITVNITIPAHKIMVPDQTFAVTLPAEALTINIPGASESVAGTATLDLTTLAAALAPLLAGSTTVTPPPSGTATAIPYIAGFTPTTGPAGTAVTFTGTGFTGMKTVGFGTAIDATFTVQSDTQMVAIVPSDAANGAQQVALINGVGEAWGGDFTVVGGTAIPPVSPPPVVTPPSTSAPGLAVSVAGKAFVNASGKAIQLLGVNCMGLEYCAAQGWDAADPWGGTAPNYAMLQAAKVNVVRYPWNAASFLALTCYVTAGTEGSPTWGASRSADPGNNYKATIATAVAKTRAIGAAIIFDLHWTSASPTLGGVKNYLMPLAQPPFVDEDMGLPAWDAFSKWIVANYPQHEDIMLELFNEPFIDNSGGAISPTDYNQLMRDGGTCGCITNQSQDGVNYKIMQTWTVVGYQKMVDVIRANGFKGVLIVNGAQWSQQLKDFQAYMPVDPLRNFAFGWHPYGVGTYPYSDGQVGPKIGADNGWAAPTLPGDMQYANDILATGYPVICTEDGGSYGPGQTTEAHISYMMEWAKSNGAGYLNWQFNNPQSATQAGVNALTINGGNWSSGQGTVFAAGIT